MSSTKNQTLKASVHFKLALLWTGLSVILHGYLTYVHFGQLTSSFSKSFCDLSALFSCSDVAASAYSKFLNIPVSLWGLMTHVIFALFLVESWSHPRPYFIRYTQWITLALVGGSLTMATISLLFMKQYCLFCIILYFLSFLTLFNAWKFLNVPFIREFGRDFLALFTVHRGVLILFLLIPVGAWLINAIIVDVIEKAYGHKNIPQLLSEKITEWQTNPKIQINIQGGIVLNEGNSKNQLIEFADFMCRHCQEAAPIFEEFIKNNPDFNFIFLTFPLDGECNDDIPRKTGISCRLAKAVYCANLQNQGPAAHHWLFKKVPGTNSLEGANQLIEEMTKALNFNAAQFTDCLNNQNTHNAIRAMAKEGVKAQIEGTPTVFLNGQLLPGAQAPAVLKAAVQFLKEKR